MRVLRLDLADVSVDLHPFMTVVRGLSPATREALLGALAAIARGDAVVPGLVEAHGVLLDLDAASLDLLDVHSEVDAVVRQADLPGAVGARQAEAERAVADATDDVATATIVAERAAKAVQGALDALAAAAGPSGADDAVDPLAAQRADLEQRMLARAEAERRLDEAIAAEHLAADAVRDAEAAVDADRKVRVDATGALSAAAAALEAAAERRDPIGAAVLDAARARLAAAEAELEGARAAGDDVGPAPVEAPPSDEELDALRGERLEAEAGVLALDTVDPSAVRLALEQLRAGGTVEPVPDPRAIELAEQLSDLEVDLAHVSTDDQVEDDLDGGDHRLAAHDRLAAAEEAVALAEAALRPVAPDPEEVKALEAAHTEVQDARDAVERLFGRRAAERRLVEAEAAERAVLARLGFETFTDYLLGYGTARRVDAAAGDRLDSARAELVAAAAEAHQHDAAVATELRRAELLDRRRELRAAAVDVLGSDPGGDLVGVLRRRRVPATETGDHLARLRGALQAAGLALEGEELPQGPLEELASVWLAEQDRALAERAALEQRLAELDARLGDATRLRRSAAAAAEDRGDDDSATTPPPSRLTAALAAVGEARSAVAAAEGRLARHRDAERDMEARRVELEEAAEKEASAVAAIAVAEAAAADARIAERAAAARSSEAAQAAAEAKAAEAAAEELLASLSERLTADDDPEAALEADLARATAVLNEARTEEARATARLEAARARLVAVTAEVEDDDTAAATDAEDAEWFLLARLAAQRSVSYAGSVPLVLDDALAGFAAEATRRLLDRLERMASTVQVVVATEDLTTAAWAESIGPERAAVVQVAVPGSGR